MLKVLYIFFFALLVQDACAQTSDVPYVLVLGIAQDGGYPHMACKRTCCTRAWTNDSLKRSVVSLALVDPKSKKWWLFEATPDIKEQLHYFQELTHGQYSFLPDGVFITHAHIGHYTGLMEFGREVISTSNLPVYVLPKLKTFLETNGPWSQLVSLNNIKLIELKAGHRPPSNDEGLSFGHQISVFTFTVPHRDEYSETAGFEIVTAGKKYLFIPDINKWDKWDHDIISEVKSVDIAMVDATFFDANDLPGRNMATVPHPLVTETMQLFANESRETKAKVHFIHFNHTNPLLWDSARQQSIRDAGFFITRQGEKL